MNKARLTMTIDALRDFTHSVERLILPPGKTPEKFRFDFSTFGQLLPDCSTVACVWGMMAMLPEFQAQGLRYRFRYKSLGVGDIPSLCIIYQDHRGDTIGDDVDGNFSAAVVFYDITFLEAEKLFHPMYYINGNCTTPQEVAENIEYFIACKESGEPFPLATGTRYS